MMSKTSINDLTTDRHPGSLEISVSGLGKNIFFRVKPETKLSRLIDACWDHRGVRFEERSWRLPRQGGYLEATDCGDTFAQVSVSVCLLVGAYADSPIAWACRWRCDCRRGLGVGRGD